jgi:hypothetical protein
MLRKTKLKNTGLVVQTGDTVKEIDKKNKKNPIAGTVSVSLFTPFFVIE